MKKGEKFNSEFEKKLFKAAQNGDQNALAYLCIKHSGLVVKIAKKYARNQSQLDDLIQEGFIGLIKAIRKFDPELGWNFSTMAVWWIRDEILRYVLKETHAVSIPVDTLKKVYKVWKAEREFEEKYSRKPSFEDLKNLGFSEDLIKLSQNLKEARLMNNLHEKYTKKFTSDIENSSLVDQIKEIIESLPLRERLILELRYIDANLKYNTIARVLGISRQRVKQLEKRAIQRIREALGEEWDKSSSG